MGVAMLTMLIGLTFAFVLIQEKLAPLLSDTMFVPGYFHFFAVGTISQTFLAALMMALPAISGRELWRPAVLSRMPWVVLAGLVLFGVGEIAAGFIGVPRRAVDIGYDGAAPAVWRTLMLLVGAGGVLFALGLSVSVYGVARSLIPSQRGAALEAVPTGNLAEAAWCGRPGLDRTDRGRGTGLRHVCRHDRRLRALAGSAGGGRGQRRTLKEDSMRQELLLLLAVVVVWFVLAAVYALRPIGMPGYARVWGAGAGVFLILAATLWVAAKRARHPRRSTMVHKRSVHGDED